MQRRDHMNAVVKASRGFERSSHFPFGNERWGNRSFCFCSPAGQSPPCMRPWNRSGFSWGNWQWIAWVYRQDTV